MIIKKGGEGTFVQQIQRALNIKDDGYFGATTEEAIKRLQFLNNITEDGIAGNLTQRLLGFDWSFYRWNGNNKKVVWQLPSSTFGLRGYNVERGGADQFGTKETINNLVKLGEQCRTNIGRDIQVGDISRLGGGHFYPHSSHKNGNACDIRPLRKDGMYSPVDCRDAAYDAVATADLVILIKGLFPNSIILFNDKVLTRRHLTNEHAGHYNHLHIQF